MNANHLLFWASALQSGSWHQFKCAAERLHLESQENGAQEEGEEFPLYQKLRFNLERLGHIEFNLQEDEWRVVPPVFALVQQRDRARAVLCGARSERLLTTVLKAAAALSISVTPLDLCPDIFLVEYGDFTEIRKISQKIHILTQPDTPESILASLPSVESMERWPRSAMPFGEGWAEEIFCPETLSWRSKDRMGRTSKLPELLRFTRYGRPLYYIRHGDYSIYVPGPMGKFFVLMHVRRRTMSYNKEKAELYTPAICRPPLFVERALVLCSGFPARYVSERKMLVYKEVPEHIAYLAARVLRQEIL
jgi:hypothetical protein